MVRVVVCGGGGGTHVVAGMASSRPDFDVIVLVLKGDKAERWTEIMRDDDFTVTVKSPTKQDQYIIQSKPSKVTNDPRDAKNCDVIILCVPAFAHAQYLEALKQYVKPGVVLVGLPGQAGFEFEVRKYWGDIVNQCVILTYDTLPWVSRLKEFGKSAVVMGTKEAIKGSALQETPLKYSKGNSIMQQIMGDQPKLIITGHILCTTLHALNGYLHPVIVYGQWSQWDGKPCPHIPEFYTGMTRDTAAILDRVSCEILAIAQSITEQRPGADFHNVDHLYDIICRYYRQSIEDTTDLYSVITTNKIYRGLHHQVIESSDGGFLPDFSHRYLTEDIPYGLAVIRGIADITEVATPTIDTVLLWCQRKMNKEYLVEGHMSGRDIGETRCPQKYGIHTLDDMLGLSPLNDWETGFCRFATMNRPHVKSSQYELF